MLWKNVIFVVIGLVLVASLGYSSVIIKTDKPSYICYLGACEPVTISLIDTKAEKLTIKITSDFSKGAITSYKLPYASTGTNQAISLANVDIAAGTSKFTFTPAISGNVKFNITAYNASGAVVAKLDPYLIYYYNRVQINISTQTAKYNRVAAPITLNESILGVDPCQDTKYCNDSIVTYLNDTPIYYYNWEYNATQNWRLFVNATWLNATDKFSFYFYYNSTNVTRNAYFNGNKVFRGYEPFENYTDGVAPSGHFGGINSPAYLNISSSGCFDGYCLKHSAGATNGDIIYGFDNVETSGIIEYRFYTDTAAFGSYLGTQLCNGAYPCGWAGSTGNIFPIAVSVGSWQYLTAVWNNSNTNVTINTTTVGNVAHGGSTAEFAGGYYSTEFYIDNLIWRDLIEDPLVTEFSGKEFSPDLDHFLIINYGSPDSLNITESCGAVTFAVIPVTSEYPIINCSLWINDSLNYTAFNPMNNTEISTTLGFKNGSYNFTWNCYAGALYNSTIQYNLTIACAAPPGCGNCTLYTLPGEDDWTLSYCLSNGSLYKEKIWTLGCNTCNYSQVKTCKYGCEGDKCNLSLEAARINSFYLIILLFAAILIVAMIAKFYR